MSALHKTLLGNKFNAVNETLSFITRVPKSKRSKKRHVNEAIIHLWGRHCTILFASDTLQTCIKPTLGMRWLNTGTTLHPPLCRTRSSEAGSPLHWVQRRTHARQSESCSGVGGVRRQWTGSRTRLIDEPGSRSGETIRLQIDCFKTICL